MTKLRVLSMVSLAVSSACLAAEPLEAPRTAFVEYHHGAAVHDPYRWMEDDADPRLVTWQRAQTEHTDLYFSNLAFRPRLKARLASLALRVTPAPSWFTQRGQRVFARWTDPALQQPTIVALEPALVLATKRVVLDPNALDPSGKTAIDWWVPSPDGQLLAASLSRDGSEIGTLHLYDPNSGRETGEVIPQVQYPTGGGGLAWSRDGRGFWYTRYPGDDAPEAERPFGQQVYFHNLGTDWHDDTLVLGERDGLPTVAEIFLGNESMREFAVAQVQNGDSGTWSHYVLSETAAVRLSSFEDDIIEAKSGQDGAIYAISLKGAPNGKIVKLSQPFQHLGLRDAPTIVPESDASIRSDSTTSGFSISQTRLLVRDINGGPERVRVFTFDGQPAGELPLPSLASFTEISPLEDGSVLYGFATYLTPKAIWRWRPDGAAGEETAFGQTAPFDFDDVEVVRETAVSEDGTRIPLSIIRRKGFAFDGNQPTLLYGYGAYGASLTPDFAGPRMRVWLDGGGVYVIAHVRGGGEFGARWRYAGNLLSKQNGIDDFAAAARYLVERGYTSPARLAIFGESAGGLLVGATMTQHPELVRAVVARVGVFDMLRSEFEPNGKFNIPEFGSVSDPAQFSALHAYSPYHRVVPGTAYPAVFLTAGEADGRVSPMHPRKFTAALQHATTSGRPVLLRTTALGHGMGNSVDATLEEDTEILAFLFDQLGIAFDGKH